MEKTKVALIVQGKAELAENFGDRLTEYCNDMQEVGWSVAWQPQFTSFQGRQTANIIFVKISEYKDMKSIKELAGIRMAAVECEMEDEHWAKLSGVEAEGGRHVRIKWKEEPNQTDTGYLFALALVDGGVDLFVHIPSPLNFGGKGAAPPVWTHLQTLLLNDRVEYIVVTE